MLGNPGRLRVFSTCPASSMTPGDYRKVVRETARLSEAAGCDGILVYTDNAQLDPWLIAQLIIINTDSLSPLVAVQPAYSHPYTVAKAVTTLASLHGRRVCLNMVAGGFRNDLLALDDSTEHDRRYDRLVEYTTIIRDLLVPDNAVTFAGEFYRVNKLKLSPVLDPALHPLITMSGSSEAGTAAASRVGAVAVEYPRPVQEYERDTPVVSLERGIRIGIIARGDVDEAWRVARARFPEDRKGQIAHQLAVKVSDSSWHAQLSQLGAKGQDERNPYWLVPFENYKTFCPYLVGDYDRVAAEVSRYVRVGYRTIILDVPASLEDMEHIGVVLEAAASAATA